MLTTARTWPPSTRYIRRRDESENFPHCNVSKITAMPTFIFIKNKAKVADLTGANVDRLKALVAEHK